MGWMTSSGVSMHYEVSGRGQRSLILVHELGGTLDSWDAVLPLLDPEFRILRFDQRGSGLSEKVRKAFNVEDHVQDLQNILEAVELVAFGQHGLGERQCFRVEHRTLPRRSPAVEERRVPPRHRRA